MPDPPRLPFARPEIDEATIAGVVEVLRSGWLASGPYVTQFEAALSQYCGGRPVRVVTSATAALEIALVTCGIGPGDEVITPAMSWCSTANVILRVGAEPVFVDVDLESRNLDLGQVEAAIGPRTRAILPVHFAGLPIDLHRLHRLARQFGLRVIEDAAHAIGSECAGRRVGSFGDIVCFSFHPNKNITSAEGGAIVLESNSEVSAVERLRFNGVVRGPRQVFDVLEPGFKANMSDLCARIGLGQLVRLDEFCERRRRLAGRYFARWNSGAPIALPVRGDRGHSWHMFAVRLPLDELPFGRERFIAEMDRRGIGVGVHYPAIHLLSAYRRRGGHENQHPNAERIGRETVTLPLFPTMTVADVDRVVDAVNEILSEVHR